jgi:hypothetical protein
MVSLSNRLVSLSNRLVSLSNRLVSLSNRLKTPLPATDGRFDKLTDRRSLASILCRSLPNNQRGYGCAHELKSTPTCIDVVEL